MKPRSPRAMRRLLATTAPAQPHELPPSTHNGGPPLEHVPPWGPGGIGTFMAWRAARDAVWKKVPRETVLRRLAAAERCGVTYEEYSMVLLGTGRYLQPGDVTLIRAIKARRPMDPAMVRAMAEAHGLGRLEIRVGEPAFADWNALHGLLVEAFAYMTGRIDPPSSLARMDAAALRRKAEGEKLVVVEDRGRLVACGFFALRPQSLYLGKLAVAVSHRRMGLLRLMVALAEAEARTLDLPALELETRVELTENHATFAALGFAVAGTFAHAGYERPTSLLMRKTLTAA